MRKKVLIAVLLCDRKAHYQLTPFQSMMELDKISPTGEEFELIYYFNVQTSNPELYLQLFDKITEEKGSDSTKQFHWDFWDVKSTWAMKPKEDQDQARLFPIVTGRNMCIDAALDLGADILQFVDSDMIIPTNTIWKLASHDRKIVGGFVRGRNGHKEASYVFGADGGIQEHADGTIDCDHGNIGFCQIKREVFSVLRFRRGPHPIKGHLQSDDPNYCYDALYVWNFGRHLIDKNVEAKHIDDDVNTFGNGAQY